MAQSSNPASAVTIPLSAEQLQALAPVLPLLAQLADARLAFVHTPPSPMTTAAFEQQLVDLTNQLGLTVMADALNSLEPDKAELLPDELHQHGTRFRRRKQVNWKVSCLFGQFTLRHFYYEPRQSQEPCLHPLADLLGIFAWCTPGLLKKAAQLHSDHSQKVTLTILAEEHQVFWSEERFRNVMAWVAQMLSAQRIETLATRVVGFLEQAHSSTGGHLPVLVAGRDGITMPIVGKSYKEGSVATLTVYDRRGRRLATVYLAQAPEPEQPRMNKELTALLVAVLRRYPERKLRLAYVTDAGYWPQWYYQNVLRKMADPAHAGKRLEWEWVVDYYHASSYVSQLAEGLFGATTQARAWAARMRHVLKENNGVRRVLQSAGHWLRQLGYKMANSQKYHTGWNYLHNYRKWMPYARNKRLGIPLGSGVTEAGCKVIVTQRLKRSGMRWKTDGAQVILDIRTAFVSGVWQLSFEGFSRLFISSIGTSYDPYLNALARNAA
jgi:hypothetical protein